MKQEETRVHWARLRFKYYISGRTLIDKGFIDSAFIMLSYALEASLKAIISEYKDNEIQKAFKDRKIRTSHNILEIFEFCQECNLVPSVDISPDFFQFVELNFNRYPYEIGNAREKWREYGGMAKGIRDILYFDDAMMQLNDCIYQKTKDPISNIGFIALTEFDMYSGRVFFHENLHALNRLESFIDLTNGNRNETWTIDQMKRFNEMDFSLAVPIEHLQMYNVGEFKFSDRIKQK